jgi:transposase
MGRRFKSSQVGWLSLRMMVLKTGAEGSAPNIMRGTAIDYYAGIDVSPKESSVCIVDAKGKVVRELKVAIEPEALVRYFDELDLPVCRIGLEAGPLSHRLHAELVAAGRDVVLLETRHVKAALSAMTVKTDPKDARGIAQLLRMSWYRAAHAKSVASQYTRAHFRSRHDRTYAGHS